MSSIITRVVFRTVPPLSSRSSPAASGRVARGRPRWLRGVRPYWQLVRAMSRAVLQVFEEYQKARVTFVQTVRGALLQWGSGWGVRVH